MTHPQRNALMRALTELGEEHPEWRFGQLVANVSGWADAEVWDVEDADLIAAARARLARTARAEPSRAD